MSFRKYRNSEDGNTTLLISVMVAGASFIGVQIMQDRAVKNSRQALGISAGDLAQQEIYASLTIAQSLFAAQNLSTWSPRDPQPSDAADKTIEIGGITFKLWDKNTYTYPPIADAPIVYVDRYPSSAQTGIGLVKTRDAEGFGTTWTASAFSSGTGGSAADLKLTLMPQTVPNIRTDYSSYFASPATVVSSPTRGSTTIKAETLNARSEKLYLVVEGVASRSLGTLQGSRTIKTRAELTLFEPPTPVCKTTTDIPSRGFYKMGESPTGKILVTGVVREIVRAEYCVRNLQLVESCVAVQGSQYSNKKNDYVFAQDLDILSGDSLQGTGILPSQLENDVYFKAVVKGTNGAMYDCDIANVSNVEWPVRTTTFFTGNGPGSCGLDGLCGLGAWTCDSYGLDAAGNAEAKGFTGDVFQIAGQNASLIAQLRARTSGNPSAALPAYLSYGNRILCHSKRPEVTSTLKEVIITDLKIVAGTVCPTGYIPSTALTAPSVRDNAACTAAVARVGWAAVDTAPGNAERLNQPSASHTWVAPCLGANQNLSFNQIVGCYPGQQWYSNWHGNFVTAHGAQCYKTWDSAVTNTSRIMTTLNNAGTIASNYTLCQKQELISSLLPTDTNKLVVYDVDMRGRTNDTTRSSSPSAVGCTTNYTAIDGGTLLDCSNSSACYGLANVVMCMGPITDGGSGAGP